MAASAGNGPWKQLPAWTFTGRFRAPPTLLPAEGGLLIGIRRRAISRSLRAADNVIEEVLPRGDLVIGKMDDLAQATGWRVGDYTLNLPPLPPGPGRWEQNRARLQEAIDQGLPIRDISPSLGGGFLERERQLLIDNGWTFDPNSGMWSP